ncbi:MAG: SGNH/GDSL hydrolase family protein, partial [Planctomycetes bacterium]|nr:SGNH/GDSL hydrolase family protein [Planctomycetota bacterium]
GWGTVVEVNSHGFRGPEVAREAAGRTRLVALGDSVTFGNDLDYAETWPAVLELELRALDPAVDVLDLGLGGYDTLQEVATLEALGLAFAPERVIVGFCANDVGIVSMSMETCFVESDRANPLYLSRIAQWLHVWTTEKAQKRALFERNLEQAYARVYADEIEPLDAALAPLVAALRGAVELQPPAEQDLATRRIPPRWYASERRLGRLQHAFARLAELAREHDFEVTLLLIPYLEDDPLIEQGFEIVRALAESRGFAVVDPRAAFRSEGLADLRLRAEDPVHPNARGHAALARSLAAHLRTGQTD